MLRIHLCRPRELKKLR
uniref:Uncharacterized protein n=1 Tax=Rhizophora mucronata TaxID=61149 RepID=A0A2P2PBZ0_RHIMU